MHNLQPLSLLLFGQVSRCVSVCQCVCVCVGSCCPVKTTVCVHMCPTIKLQILDKFKNLKSQWTLKQMNQLKILKKTLLTASLSSFVSGPADGIWSVCFIEDAPVTRLVDIHSLIGRRCRISLKIFRSIYFFKEFILFL